MMAEQRDITAPGAACGAEFVEQASTTSGRWLENQLRIVLLPV